MILPVTFVPGTLPSGLDASPQEYYEAILAATSASFDASAFLLGQIGGAQPPTNVGPWLKNTKEWWVWDQTEGTYVPMSNELEIGDLAMTAKANCDDDHWLFCDGREISRSTPFDKLFAAIGTNYGPGNGTTTFNLPSTGSRSPMGVGIGRDADGNQLTLRSLYEKGGLEKVILTGEDIPGSNYFDAADGDGTRKCDRWQNYYRDGEPHNNLHPWFSVLFKIKYR